MFHPTDIPVGLELETDGALDALGVLPAGALLHRVGQFVGEQGSARVGGHVGAPVAEEHVLTEGERSGAELFVERGASWPSCSRTLPKSVPNAGSSAPRSRLVNAVPPADARRIRELVASSTLPPCRPIGAPSVIRAVERAMRVTCGSRSAATAAPAVTAAAMACA